MNLIDKAFTLKKSPLFCQLGLELLLAIADKTSAHTFANGAVIFAFEQPAHQMYFLIKGEVQLRDRKRKVVGQLRDHDFFGDESLFNEEPRTYSAICTSKCQILCLSRTHLLTIINECPSVAVRLLEAYSLAVPFRQNGMA